MPLLSVLVVTHTLPLEPFPITAVIEVELFTVNAVDTPPIFTPVTFIKLLPLILTVVPVLPEVGIKLVTVGDDKD